jgi:hypothetical protein
MSGGKTMTELRKAAEDALGFLDWYLSCNPPFKNGMSAYKKAEALRQALAQPEQKPVDTVNTSQKRVDETAKREHEPVGWADRFEFDKKGHDFWCNRQKPAKGGIPLYTAPPKREWVGLTDDEIMDVSEMRTGCEKYQWVERIIRNSEAKLKEKNGYE